MSIELRSTAKLLESEFPLMRTTIRELIIKARALNPIIAQLIAEYFCPPDRVETEPMVALFQESIPILHVEQMKSEYYEMSSCFDGIPYTVTEVFRNSRPLRNSTERQLVAWTWAYFDYHTSMLIQEMDQETCKFFSAREQLCEFFDFLGRIDGITVLSKNTPQDETNCQDIVFGKKSWFKREYKILFDDPKKVLRYLHARGYSKMETPAKGQVVVYHSKKKTHHFAKICEIDSEGTVIVMSKFYRGHVFKHPIELTPFRCGNSVTFLNEPKY